MYLIIYAAFLLHHKGVGFLMENYMNDLNRKEEQIVQMYKDINDKYVYLLKKHRDLHVKYNELIGEYNKSLDEVVKLSKEKIQLTSELELERLDKEKIN